MKDHHKGILLASTTAFLWAVLAIVLKFIVAHVQAVNIVWFRFLFAFVVLLALNIIRTPEQLSVLRRPPLRLILVGILLALNYVGFLKGIELTSPSNAQILIQMAPLGLAVCGIVLFKEPFRGPQKLGFVLALIGFAFFYRDGFTNFVDNLDVYRNGNFWILFAAMTWTTYAVLNKVLLRELTSNQINLAIYLTATLLLVVFTEPAQFTELTPGIWALLIFAGLNTLVAYGCLAESFRYIPAYQISFIIVCNPLLTLILMSIIGRLGIPELSPQRLGLGGWIGALLVIGGSVAVNFRTGDPAEPTES